MPGNHGIRIDQHEAVGPLPPRTAKKNTGDPIGRPKLGSDAHVFEDGQLLAQGEILDADLQRGPEKEAVQRDNQTAQRPNHASASPVRLRTARRPGQRNGSAAQNAGLKAPGNSNGINSYRILSIHKG